MVGFQPWEHPTDFVYHYTSTGGLMGILATRKIWLTNAGFLNDAEELSYGAKRAAVLLRQRAEQEKGEGKNGLATEYVISTLQSVAESIERINEPDAPRFEFPYVACFSYCRDDLSQWRGYGADGYCIAFHRESLRRWMVPEGVVPGIGSNIPMLEDISYGQDGDDVIAKQISLMVSSLYQQGAGKQGSGIETYYLIKKLVVPALSLIKHPAFVAEREVRLYLVDTGELHFRASPLGPVPYSQVEFNQGAIAEVMVAPGSNSARRVRAAEEFLLNNGLHSVPVTTSAAPFVG